MLRDEGEIKKEYIELCTRAGELQYQIQQMQSGLQEINKRILVINQEFVDLKKAQEKTAAPEKGAENVSEQAQTD